jgi:nitroreductase
MRNHIFEVMVSLLENRKTVRDFSHNNMISEEAIYDLIETSKKAPMAGGINSTSIMLFRLCDDNLRKLFYRATFYQQLVLSAHYAVMFSGDCTELSTKYNGQYAERFCCQNATIQAYNFMLLAESINVHSCFVGGIREDLLNSSIENIVGKKVYSLVFI